MQDGKRATWVRLFCTNLEYLHVKQLPLRPYAYLLPDRTQGAEPLRDDDARALEGALRDTVRQDRALYELGMRAFVSYVKAYSKHEVNYIFRLTDLPLDRLACEFALLSLPRMPEVARWCDQVGNRTSLFYDEAPNVRGTLTQLRTFAYADKQREKQRLAALERKDAEVQAEPKPSKAAPREAWSEQKRRKEVRDVRREKKERKRRWLQEQAATQAQASEESEDDWVAEERAAKKLKQGKIPQEAFNAEFFSAL